jgi:tRNA(fMet)-specific endonuclease VapC
MKYAALKGAANIQVVIFFLSLEPTPLNLLQEYPTTVSELVYGALKSDRPEQNLSQVDLLLEAVTVLTLDESAARRCGRIKNQLRRQGLLIAEPDLQIASIALENALPLVTHNQKHFKRIPDLILRDWII